MQNFISTQRTQGYRNSDVAGLCAVEGRQNWLHISPAVLEISFKPDTSASCSEGSTVS
jgi:hypothetical protein